MAKSYCTYCMTPIPEGKSCPKCGLTEGNYVAASHHLPPGTVLFNRYLVGRVLGEGGFGITYIGCDLKLELKVAIKEYYPRDRASRTSSSLNITSQIGNPLTYASYERGKQKFLKEAITMAKMEKQKVIVGVKDHFEENNTAYIVMEYIEGTTFSKLTEQRGGGIPPDELFELVEPLFGALSELHELGLIHRDISPDNIMLENGNIRLLDFGCAREAEQGTITTSTIAVKQDFAPIEQYMSKGQGAYTDIYSLAATMYFCLTGKPPERPFDRIGNDELIPPSKLGVRISPAKEKVLMHALRVEPNRRYQTVKEMWAALYTVPDDNPVPDGEDENYTLTVDEDDINSNDSKDTDTDDGINEDPDSKKEEEDLIIAENTVPWYKKRAFIFGASAAAAAVIAGIIITVSVLSGRNDPAVAAVSTSVPAQSDISEPEQTASTAAPDTGTPETTTTASSLTISEMPESDEIVYTEDMLDEFYNNAFILEENDDVYKGKMQMLMDDKSVKAIVIRSHVELADIYITKPVFVDEGFDLSSGSVEITESGCISVAGTFESPYLRLHGSGSRIFVKSGNDLRSERQMIVFDDKENFGTVYSKAYNENNNLINYSDDIFEGDVNYVSTWQEFRDAVNNDNKPIVITSDLKFIEREGDEYLYTVNVPVKIAEGASIYYSENLDFWDRQGMLYFAPGSFLVNEGSLNGSIVLDGTFINYGNTDNEHFIDLCDGGSIVNYGSFGLGIEPRNKDKNIRNFVNRGTVILDHNSGITLRNCMALNSGLMTVKSGSVMCIEMCSTFDNFGVFSAEEDSAFYNYGVWNNQSICKSAFADNIHFVNSVMLLNYCSFELGKNTLGDGETGAIITYNNYYNYKTPDNVEIMSVPSYVETQRDVNTKEELIEALADNKVISVCVASDIEIDEDITVSKDLRLEGYITMKGDAKFTAIDADIFSTSSYRENEGPINGKYIELYNCSLNFMYGYHTLYVESGGSLIIDNSNVYAGIKSYNGDDITIELSNSSFVVKRGGWIQNKGTKLTVGTGSKFICPEADHTYYEGAEIVCDGGSTLMFDGSVNFTGCNIHVSDDSHMSSRGRTIEINNTWIHITENSRAELNGSSTVLSGQTKIENEGNLDMTIYDSFALNHGSSIFNNGQMSLFRLWSITDSIKGEFVNNGILYMESNMNTSAITGNGQIKS